MSQGPKRALAIAGIALLLYALLGFLVLPGVALHVINGQLRQYATVPARLERLEFNPFSLELSAFGLQIGEPGKAPVVLPRLYANLQWNSLWKGALHLRAVTLEHPQLEVLFDKQGTLNLGKLFSFPSTEPSSSAEEQALFPVRIDRISLLRGALRYADARPEEMVDQRYDDLNLELSDLSTLPDESGGLRLAANANGAGRLELVASELTISPLRAAGQLKLSDIDLVPFRPYLRQALPVVLEHGALNLAAAYRFALADTVELSLEDLSTSVSRLNLQRLDGAPLASLDRLAIANGEVDLARQEVTIGTLRSENLKTAIAREPDGQLDWQRLLATEGPASPPEPLASETHTSSETVSEEPPNWRVRLRDGQLRNYRIDLTDQVPETPVRLAVGPLDLDIRDFDSAPDAPPFDLRLDTRIGDKGRVAAQGQVGLAPVQAKLAVELAGLNLALAQPYLSPFVKIELRSGVLGGKVDVALAGTTPLQLSVQGNARIDSLETVDQAHQRDLVKWTALQLQGLDYQHGQSFAVEHVGLQQPYLRFIVNDDLTTNLNQLVVPQPPDNTPQDSSEASTRPLAIRIGDVQIEDGSANFADFSLRPPFGTAIQSLNGRIGTLDNQRGDAASVDIEGAVDRYAPVTIKGQLTPFDPLQQLDLTTVFRNVELTTLTPYSSKFAGYRIRKGRLNLDLQYRIVNSRLNARNHVVLDQLQLGERVDSPDAVDLPVRLAVALLKDTHGRIDIALPVSGDLGDPQFSVMPIVWQTLRNLVLRAAQAPFKFLAGLVAGGSDQDLGQVPFPAGTETLAAPATTSLSTLARALAERPALGLEVQGRASVAADGPSQARKRLEWQYASLYRRMLQRRGETVADSPEVPDSAKPDLLAAIYREQIGQPPAEWKQLGEEKVLSAMQQTVLARWQEDPEMLRRLAQQRAAAIKQYLVETAKVSAERIYLVDVDLTDEPGSDGTVSSQLEVTAK